MLTFYSKDELRDKGVLEEYDGILLTDGVKYVDNIVKQCNNKKIVEIKEYDTGLFALGVQRTQHIISYVSPLWVKTIGGQKVEDTQRFYDTLSKNYAVVNKEYVWDTKTYILHHISEITVCTKCGETEVHEEGLCTKCYIDTYYEVHTYSYKPTPEFKGKQLNKDREHPVWYGIELEYGINSKLPMVDMVRHNGAYLKDDSSIMTGDKGSVEMVTHPMSFREAIKFANNIDTIDAIESPETNGCHIHVSKTAFVDDRHYAMMYYLLSNMGKAGVLEEIGGRKFTTYCAIPEKVPHIARISKTKASNGERAVFINDTGRDTVEFRFFASTTTPAKLKRYLQLLESVLKYTRYHKRTVSYEGWRKYVAKYGTKKYKELNSFLKTVEVGTSIPNVVYQEPRVIIKNTADLKISECQHVIKGQRDSCWYSLYPSGDTEIDDILSYSKVKLEV